MTTTIQQFVKDLNAVAARIQGDIAGKLVNNTVGSLEEYKHQTGIAKGVGMLAEQAYQLMKRGDLDDEDDREPLGRMPTPDGGPQH